MQASAALKISPVRRAALRQGADFATNGHLMSLAQQQEAWLEREGERHVLHGNCSVGRAALNTLILDLPKVSRLHSINRNEIDDGTS